MHFDYLFPFISTYWLDGIFRPEKYDRNPKQIFRVQESPWLPENSSIRSVGPVVQPPSNMLGCLQVSGKLSLQWFVIYLFRELPGLAKQFIMRLLHVQQAVPQAVVSSWVTHQFAQESQVSKENLTSLRVSRGFNYLFVIGINLSYGTWQPWMGVWRLGCWMEPSEPTWGWPCLVEGSLGLCLHTWNMIQRVGMCHS